MSEGKATTDKNHQAESREGIDLGDAVNYLAPLVNQEQRGRALLERLRSEPAACKRINALREQARNRLRTGLSGCWHRLFEQSPLRLLASELSWREFLPPFRDHAARLFDVWAECLLTARGDEEEYIGALNLLPPMIHDEIAPRGGAGDWEHCLTTAWRRFTAFERSTHDKPVQMEIIEAMREQAPERNPKKEAFSKAILEVLWQQVDEWKARFHSRDSESRRPVRQEIPTQGPAQSPRGRRLGGTRGPEVSVDHQSIYNASLKKYREKWKEHLDEIAEQLQRKKVPVRKRWKQLSPKVHGWNGAASSIPHLMMKAVQRSIQYVRQHPESYSL